MYHQIRSNRQQFAGHSNAAGEDPHAPCFATALGYEGMAQWVLRPQLHFPDTLHARGDQGPRQRRHGPGKGSQEYIEIYQIPLFPCLLEPFCMCLCFQGCNAMFFCFVECSPRISRTDQTSTGWPGFLGCSLGVFMIVQRLDVPKGMTCLESSPRCHGLEPMIFTIPCGNLT